MSTMEILLLVGGLAAFIISFFLPDGRKEEPGKGISREEVERLFDDEVELSRQKIDDMTKETLDYSMEKTERSLEKIANEKILAVGEYSDTVLDQINQSHNQVVFLSDMLHKSKEELTDLLNRAEQASRDAGVRANEAYDLASSAKKLAEDAAERAEEAGRNAVSAEEKMIDARRMLREGAEAQPAVTEEPEAEAAPEEIREPSERYGAEERLADNLSRFKASLEEAGSDPLAAGEAGMAVQTEFSAGPEPEFSEVTEIPAGPETAETSGISELSGISGMSDISEMEEETQVSDWDTLYAGLSEEEKMEALLRAATEELAQDVHAVAGFAETEWEQMRGAASEEETAAAAEEPAAELTEAEFTEAGSSEAETAPSDLQESVPDGEPAVISEAVEAAEAESDAVSQETAAEPPAREPEAEEIAEEVMAALREETPKTARSAAKKRSSGKTAGSGRKKQSAGVNEQLSIPAELLDPEGVSLQFSPGEESTKNTNARILEMHRMGRSDMAIAKDLGMGIGEVKLVIALDEIS